VGERMKRGEGDWIKDEEREKGCSEGVEKGTIFEQKMMGQGKQLGRLTKASEEPTRDMIRIRERERERKVTGGRSKPRGNNIKCGRE
jgi:hypothetical protein